MAFYRSISTILYLLFPALVTAVQFANYKCNVNNTHSAIELYVYKDTETIQKVYAQGFEATCLATGTGTAQDPFTIVVPLDPNGVTTTAGQMACGVNAEPPGSQNYVLRILTQSLDTAFKATDRRYTVSCDPTAPVTQDSQTQLITVDQQTSFIDGTSTEITESVSINLVDYSTGQLLTVASFTQMVRLQVILTTVLSGATGVRVTSCRAVGGLLAGAPMLSLITDGCGDNSTGIIPETSGFETNGIDHTITISPLFRMFMFTDSQLPVIFSCQVEFCYGGEDCTRTCNAVVSRRKRQAEDRGGKEVAAVVTVTESREAAEQAQLERTCSDWPYVVSLAAVSFVLLMTLGFVMWFYSQLRNGQKQ